MPSCFHTLSATTVHAQLRQLHGLRYNYYRADENTKISLVCWDFHALLQKKPLEAYAKAVYELGERCGIEMNFKAQGIDEKNGRNILVNWPSLLYEDQCSPANPRLPMVDHMQEIIEDAYYGYKERPGRRK